MSDRKIIDHDRGRQYGEFKKPSIHKESVPEKVFFVDQVIEMGGYFFRVNNFVPEHNFMNLQLVDERTAKKIQKKMGQ